MELRQITEKIFVSPQITPEDLAQLADVGIATIICNRPDAENPAALQAAALEAAASAAGIDFVYNPMGAAGLSMDMIDEQSDAIEGSTGKVLAYCASGTRSAVLSAFALAGHMARADILDAIAKAGYPMPQLAAQIDQVAAQRADG
ncbi:TIGR01244 family sulfur transferase [Rhodobacteraceae bacterium XHP0102]|nr:TIGR01244 family sulfur transferase [Rhodobacteraceae bacterium XHP0102]